MSVLARKARRLVATAFLLALALVLQICVTAGSAAAADRTVSGCDPFTGQLVNRSIDELISPTRTGPTPQYVSPDRNGAIGTVWTPSCEPTSTTGNGSCFKSERSQVLVVEAEPSLVKLLAPNLPVGLKLQIVWVVLKQEKNDSTSDFLTFFMTSPIVTADFKGTWSPTVQAQYTHAWYALYRVLTNPPEGTNLPSASVVWTAFATYGQFLAMGGLLKDTSALNIPSLFGAPVLPPPFLTGQFDGGRVGLSLGGTTAGLTSWAGPYAIDINNADPTNIGAILNGPSAPGGTPAAIATIPGDVVKIQPDLVSSSVTLGAPINAIMGSMFKGTPLGWLNTLQASASTGLVLDQLDMASFKTSTGIEQGGAIEMVIRVPLLLTLDFAPAGSAAANQASTWWNSVKNDSKWAAWAQNARASANFTGGPYLGIRYTKKVDLAGRTPATTGNLALWKDIKSKYGFAPASVASLFGPDGSAAIQMYNGALITVGNPLGALSLGIPGTKTRVGLTDLTTMKVSGSVTEQYHQLIDAWHNTPGQNGISWKSWDGCKNYTYAPDPNSAIYGPKFQSYFAPGPYDLFNPNAPKYTWPSGPGVARLVQPLLDNVTSTFTTAATEVAATASVATKVADAVADAATTAANWVKCTVLPSSCKKVDLLYTDKGTLGTTSRFYDDRTNAKAGKDGFCSWGQSNTTNYACITINDGRAPTITFPAAGTVMWYGGGYHKANRTPPASGWMPYCVPEWYRASTAFHDNRTPFKNDPVPPNVYYCAFWTP